MPIEGQGGVPLFVRMSSLPPIPAGRLLLVGLLWTGEKALQLVVCGVRLPVPNKVLVIQDSTDRREAKVF